MQDDWCPDSPVDQMVIEGKVPDTAHHGFARAPSLFAATPRRMMARSSPTLPRHPPSAAQARRHTLVTSASNACAGKGPLNR